MKKYILASLLVGVAVFGFTSCADDNDSNPTIQQPESFTLNTPAYAGNVYDLENCKNLQLTWSQPAYGYTAAVTYYTQVSLTNEWKNTTTAEDGTEVKLETPKFVELDGSTTQAQDELKTEAINRAILKMGGYGSEQEMPETSELYVRMRAKLQSGYECYSNVIQLNVKAYYAALTAADPELWYLIGGCVGDGSWDKEIGRAVYPMSPIEGGEYDEITGQGILTYTGYFTSEKGFKIVKTPGDWAEQWGGINGDITQPKKKDDSGEGSDFVVPSSGYYTITLNTKENTLSIKESTTTPKEFASISIAGAFSNDNWGTDVTMEPVDTWEGARPHVWRLKKTFEKDTELKFKQTGSWDSNWGASGFPYGWGANNGANIPVKAGEYLILFNDITGYYHFYAQ